MPRLKLGVIPLSLRDFLCRSSQLANLLLLGRVQQLLLELSDGRVVVAVADDPIDGAGDIAAANVADDRSVFALEVWCLVAQPVVVFDGCLDPTILGYFDPHCLEELPRVPEKLLVLCGCAFPEVNVEWLISDDLRSGR